MGLPRVLLIANRGEIVARVARTARSMGIRTVAVASDADRGALHTRVCDEVVHLGGVAAADSYLRVDELLTAAERSGADAIHPGFGFLAEDATFAQAVIDAGLIWVGPSPQVIASMGDKLTAKRLMAANGVPIIEGVELAPVDAPVDGSGDGSAGGSEGASAGGSAGASAGASAGGSEGASAGGPGGGSQGGSEGASGGAADDVVSLQSAAAQLGFPVLIKATAGGGGKGMRVVYEPEALADEVAAARREAGAAFGDDRVFLERFIERSRHVEVQVLGDGHGNLVHLFERECSIQRRHQKIVEESPSPGIDEQVRTALTDAALAAAGAIGYSSAGTVEFIVDEVALARRRAGEDVPAASTFAFLEVNTRLQVEHPVTEETVRRRDPVTGSLERIDLVREQLLVAAGERLAFEQQELIATGHAIEVRLYAEDPAAGDLPGAGAMPVFEPVGGPGIRWEAGIAAGDVVPSAYDPMLAKVIASAPTRSEAAARLAATLDATPLLGVPTNRDLLVQILRDEAFLAGETTTALLGERRDAWLESARPTRNQVLRAASIAGLHATVWAQRDALVPGVPAGFTNAASFPVQHSFRAVDASMGSGHDGPGHGDDPIGDLVVRVRPRRAGGHLVQVLTGVAPAHLDDEVEVARSAVMTIHDLDAASLTVDIDGQVHRAAMNAAGPGDGRVQVAIGASRVTLQQLARFPHAVEQRAAGASVSPMPGAVVEVTVAVGDRVEIGAVLATVEAMKTEHRVRADTDGTVTEIRVEPGQQVDADQVLVVVSTDGADES